jgi:hypothetical protein
MTTSGAESRRPSLCGPAAAAGSPRPSYLRVLLAWALTGLLGGHHFLLGRYLHGLLWLTSCGGFGVGWAADLWRLTRFIDDACGVRRGAAFDGGVSWAQGLQHYVAGLVFAAWYTALAKFACHAWGLPFLSGPAALCVVLLSIWAVDNCSRARGSSLKAVAAAGACAAAVALLSDGEYSYITSAAQLASFFTSRQRDTSAGSRDVALTASQAALVGAVLAAVMASVVVRLAAELEDGQLSVGAVLASVLRVLGAKAEVRTGGFESRKFGDAHFRFGHERRFTDDFGHGHEYGYRFQPPPLGGSSSPSSFDAAKLLGLRARPGWRPTAQEVKDAYRSLSLQHHPDKVPPSERAAAEAMQIQLNAAREVLMKRMPRD